MKEVLVIKYGSSSVTDDNGINQARIDEYCRQLAALSHKYGLIVVSSGAAVAGKARWREVHHKEPTDFSQPYAMLGSAEASLAWQQGFQQHAILAAQLLVTHREIEDPSEGWSLNKVLKQNIAHNIVTIVNENDALSNQELAKLVYGGDNDGLASHIAVSVKAKTLCLLTGVNGLLDGGRVLKSISYSDADHQLARSLAGTAGAKGRGGMISKVEAAIAATQKGITTYIANADEQIDQIFGGHSGTVFIAKSGQSS